MRLLVHQRLAYASGNFGKSLFWTSLDYLLLFYMTDVLDIPPHIAGVIILISLLWDGVSDPLVGNWIDTRAAKGLDYRPFLFWGPPLAALLFATIFLPPPLESTSNAVYLLITLLLFRSAYSILDIPHNALLAYIPVGRKIRAQLASMRYFFSSLGGLLIALIVAPEFKNVDELRSGNSPLIFSVLAGILICLTVWQSLPIAKSAHASRFEVRSQPNSIGFIRVVISSPHARMHLTIAAIFAFSTPLFAKSMPYLFRYTRLDIGALPNALLMLTIGQMIAMPVWLYLTSRKSTKVSTSFAFGGLVTALCSFFVLQAQSLWIVSSLVGLVGFFLSCTIMLIWATAGDVADKIERDCGLRADGSLMSLFTMIQKASIGLGSLFAGMVLQQGGFRAGAVQEHNAHMAIQTVTFLLPITGALLTGLIFARFQRQLSI